MVDHDQDKSSSSTRPEGVPHASQPSCPSFGFQLTHRSATEVEGSGVSWGDGGGGHATAPRATVMVGEVVEALVEALGAGTNNLEEARSAAPAAREAAPPGVSGRE